jgi:hypothetical protein
MNNQFPLWSSQIPIIVVSSTDNNGRIWDSAQYQSPVNSPFSGAVVNVWAPSVNIKCARTGVLAGYLSSGTSGGEFRLFSECFEHRITLRCLAAASVSGLIAYFLNIPKHLAKIQAYHNILGNSPYDWSNAVKQYVTVDMAYGRSGNPANFMIYNGEIPIDSTGQPVCAANPNPLPKRQSQGAGADTCLVVSPEAASSMSAASAAASASSASVASVSSASVVSVSSAEARSSRTATAAQPSFTGYLGDQCTLGLKTDLNLEVANAAIQDFCSGDWIWSAKGQPPTGTPANNGVTGANITATVTATGSQGSVITTLEVAPDDGAGACSVGGYPRSLNNGECVQGFNSLFHWCK